MPSLPEQEIQTTDIQNALEDLKAQNILTLDVREQSSFTDLMIVCTGRSRRHVMAIVDEVVLRSKRAGVQILGVEGTRSAEWVLIDLGDVVIHVMRQEAREFYDLERFWAPDVSAQQTT